MTPKKTLPARLSVSALCPVLAGWVGVVLFAASACLRGGLPDASSSTSDGAIDSPENPEGAADAAEPSAPAACPGDGGGGGALDPSFGDGGIVLLAYPAASPSLSGAYAARVQVDGKVLIGGRVSGTPVLVRFLPNGSLDSDFGANGLVTAEIMDAGYSAMAHGPYAALGVQPDGKIIAAAEITGAAGAWLMVARYLSNGTPDPSFGDGGSVRTDFDESPYALIVLESGQIVVSGTGDTALARFNADGTIDATFGNGGRAPAVPGSGYGAPAPGAVTVLSGGDIVLAGGTRGLMRYSASGTPFGDGGTVALGGPDAGANDVAVDAMGRFVVAEGAVDDQGRPFAGNFVIARVLETGVPDPAFGSNGVAMVDFGGTAAALGVSLRPDGTIIAVGTRATGPSSPYGSGPTSPFEVVAARLTSSGTLDTAFGVHGKLVVSLAPKYDLGARAFAEGCGLVIAGNAVDPTSPNPPSFAVLRLTP